MTNSVGDPDVRQTSAPESASELPGPVETGATITPPLPGLDQLPDPCTSAQLAAAFGKSAMTIVDWCQERRYTGIPCFRLGNRWYHRKAELVRWLNGVKSGQVEFRRKPRVSAERR